MSLPDNIQQLCGQSLPPAPSIIQRLLHTYHNDEADFDDLIKPIKSDKDLALQVKTYGASPYYAAEGAVKTLKDAIVRVLGYDMVLHIALAIAFKNSIGHPEKTTSPENTSHWKDAILVAALTERLLRVMPKQKRLRFGSMHLASLLHNADLFISPEWVANHFTNPLVISPSQLLIPLLQYWKIPEPAITAIEQQDNPSYNGAHWQYSLGIHIAKHILKGLNHHQYDLSSVDEQWLKKLYIDPDQLEEISSSLAEATHELETTAHNTFAPYTFSPSAKDP